MQRDAPHRRQAASGYDAAPRPGNLPAELDGLVGRAGELDALLRLLASERCRTVTVTGTGGVGKSRLALRAAAAVQSQDRFCDGVWLVELATVRDPRLLEHALAEALGLTDHTGRPTRSVLAERLAERELLLVLDGGEHLTADCAGLAVELLRRAPGLRLLVAARRPLEIPGEHVVPLAPLPVTGERSAAVRLFAQRAAEVLPGFGVTEANGTAVTELCRRLDGLPLALELAAVRLRALSVEQLLDRLGDRFGLLSGGDRRCPPHHHALRTAIGWSHELCTPAQRLLWARMSVFAGPFDLDAVEYVCTGSGLAARDVLETVAALVAQSVVVRDEGPDGARYRMLETVREYGAGWLEALGETERLRRRHRDWYLGLATWCELDWFSPRQAQVAERIGGNLSNLRLALEFSLQGDHEPHVGLYLAGTLWFYWVGCGRLAEGRHWLDRALEQPCGNTEARAKALWVTGYVSVLQGDTSAALAALHECRDLAERTGNDTAAAYALHSTGCLALVCDDMQRAEELIGMALARYREIGELNSNVLMGQVELAMAVAFQGDLEGAVALCEEVREICQDHGERWALAYALYVLAYAAWARGEADRAVVLLREGLAIGHAFHDLVGTVLSVELLALLAEGDGAGDAHEAAVLQGAASSMWRSVGLRLFGSRFFNAPHTLCEERLLARMGSEAYAAALEEGALLGLDAAVARALGGAAPVPGARPGVRVPPCARPPGIGPAGGQERTAESREPYGPDQRA
jgi:predicted ATPase